MEIASTMADDLPHDLNRRIGDRVKTLRAGKALSIEALAQTSGVSRSMISLIERGEASPTATVLEKVAAGLDVSLASLFERPGTAETSPVSRRAAQALWKDPASGYVRRNVSPAGTGSPIQIVEVEFPSKAHVAYETVTRGTPVHQQVWVLDGAIDLTVGETTYKLTSGDCVAFKLDQPTAFHNPTARTARYVVVLSSSERGHRG